MTLLYYAHRTESSDKSEWQMLTTHLNAVGKLAGNFADAFGAKEWGELAGRLHDYGKFSTAFQRRLEGSPLPVDHATAGAQFIVEELKSPAARILAYVIAGHHSGLPDHGTPAGNASCLAMRLNKCVEPYRTAAESAMPITINQQLRLPILPGIHRGLQFSLFTRMLFSCLIDADSLDSEKYADARQSEMRRYDTSFAELFSRFQLYMSKHFAFPDSTIKKARGELLDECLTSASGPQGLYTLTMPTGSGKTLASLGFALKHAVLHKLRRIVYVIPYTSIIEQNAAVFRNVLGDENILEHHSNVQHESSEYSDESRPLHKKLLLAEENWDYPVVVTTNVQFFESLFSNRRSRCRKLHNLAGSVIVLDEAQLMNGEFFKPCLYVLEELVRNYGVTVVLSTATQPDIPALFPKPVDIREMVHDVPRRFEQFRRVRLQMLGLTDYDRLADRLSEDRQALCIVNTRRAARELYEKIAAIIGKDGVYHLSARMCPKHRLQQLKIIRSRLQDHLPCVLISTQLVECGVDVDFPTVYRELAGLDSIAQAAGRCNRNGNRRISVTYVFETEASSLRGWFGMTAGVTRMIFEKYPDDPLSLAAVRDYFRELYFYQTLGGSDLSRDLTDKHRILCHPDERPADLAFPFQVIADLFQLIDTVAKPVIVPYDEDAEKHLASLQHATKINGTMRKLQPYVVQLYPPEFTAFQRAGIIVEVRENVFKLTNKEHWYDHSIGIKPFSEVHHASELYVF